MSAPRPIRLVVEALERRDAPSGFGGLEVAVSSFAPTDPCMQCSPPFALNYGTPDLLHARVGLETALSHLIPTDPCRTASPVFVGLMGEGSVIGSGPG